jgi:predicted nucleic acid-binding protein
MLCDTGPLVAIIDRSDKNHARCLQVLATLLTPLLTTWPCFTEAMYLLARYGGQPAQDTLWGYVEDGIITFHISSEAEQRQMRVLMQKYRDTPMDLADASLVAAAHVLNVTRIFTTDSDFYVYQIGGIKPFEVLP